jgi:hypothetical protein
MMTFMNTVSSRHVYAMSLRTKRVWTDSTDDLRIWCRVPVPSTINIYVAESPHFWTFFVDADTFDTSYYRILQCPGKHLYQQWSLWYVTWAMCLPFPIHWCQLHTPRYKGSSRNMTPSGLVGLFDISLTKRVIFFLQLPLSFNQRFLPVALLQAEAMSP